ncbi:MAG: HAD family hydrolase [Pseudomonadota bacterium]
MDRMDERAYAGEPSGLRRAVFLDRDGVINRKLPEDRYVRSVDEFHFLPGVMQALGVLRELGFLLVVVTNQRGIARGMMTEKDLDDVHAFMRDQAAKWGTPLDAVYHCPHDKWENCSCRKPKPGMLIQASLDLDIDVARSYLAGDSDSDIKAGIAAGARTVRILPDDGTRDAEVSPDISSEGLPNETESSAKTMAKVPADFTFPSLLEFARFLKGLHCPTDREAVCGNP